MILYLGSSSLIKLYAAEEGSGEIADWVRDAEVVATCRIAYTEVISVLDARFRRGDISAEDYKRAIDAFNRDWEFFAKADFDDREAGRLVRERGLTRFGAIHLSAAKLIASEYRRRFLSSTDNEGFRRRINLFFSSADPGLMEAATAEGLKVLL